MGFEDDHDLDEFTEDGFVIGMSTNKRGLVKLSLSSQNREAVF